MSEDFKLITRINGVQREEETIPTSKIHSKLLSMGRTKQYGWLSNQAVDTIEISITKGVDEKIQKSFDYEPIEYIQCPYCGSKLNRVGKENLIPTSCKECDHHDIVAHIKKAWIED